MIKVQVTSKPELSEQKISSTALETKIRKTLPKVTKKNRWFAYLVVAIANVLSTKLQNVKKRTEMYCERRGHSASECNLA
ncbi:hypothetical protein BpHYR1_009130 [Brachionus plicatilis]|uniref:Uncharacterized protein n=1 Tax=Brachionus plicatilis TaxID=10195 RepID=A0A3M7SG17_BRAPC|nr:hypothetical protein BpHYR1_009130 [Brachionus plicatilis]